ncbi:MAG: hypothetical protein U5L00_05180 [Desulfovermiculus sp.]|nr:hypothetical protein [Desulfovermiculus sp.]
MNYYSSNPFNITKAVDFTDEQILSNWVDLPGDGGFNHLIKPLSAMPMFIVGGKGSGKTHIMRHFSYPLQKLRFNADEVFTSLQDDGYVGIYYRLGGLNSSRFHYKNFSDEVWLDVFAYYIELIIAQLTLSTVNDIIKKSPDLQNNVSPFISKVIDLFDTDIQIDTSKVDNLIEYIRKLQKDIDYEVNNCAFTEKLNIKILVTRGSLIFGIPNCFNEAFCEKEVLFVYLLDELENILEFQQKYINTLVREKVHPSSFRIGSRLFGIRTLMTYSADEEIKESSEYERLHLDDLMRRNPNYNKFSKILCAKRLIKHFESEFNLLNEDQLSQKLSELFEYYSNDTLFSTQTNFILKKFNHKDRPYLKKLKNQLYMYVKFQYSKSSIDHFIDNILLNLGIYEYPILEKVNILNFYSGWSKNKNLLELSEFIKQDSQYFLTSQNDKITSSKLSHFNYDLLAQLLRECDKKQEYFGIDTFINMSSGTPKNYLTILKFIYQWAIFYGDEPFVRDKISIKSQNTGTLEASRWFERDAMFIGWEGEQVQKSINRLATLFREVRFSDKPSECSLTTFSIDYSNTSSASQLILDYAVRHSYLLKIPRGQKDRNTKRIDDKYRLNPMLCPKWDLPIYSRGTISFNSFETEAIFNPSTSQDDFETTMKKRISKMNVPFDLNKPTYESKSLFDL